MTTGKVLKGLESSHPLYYPTIAGLESLVRRDDRRLAPSLRDSIEVTLMLMFETGLPPPAIPMISQYCRRE